MQNLVLRLLGDLDVDGLDLQALGSRKARALLWLLALGRGSSVPMGAIVESLWPGDAPARPNDQVAVLVSRARAVLGRDRLERTDSGYRLHYDWLDVDELAALTDEAVSRSEAGNVSGAAAAARVAMSLLRRDPVPPDGAGAWVEAELASLARAAAHSRHTAASALLASGAWLEAADVAAEAIEKDPYDEHALRLMMRANAAGGRTAAALAAYATFSRRLVDELGSNPSPATEAVHVAVLRGDLGSGMPSPGSRRLGRRELVGRQEQLGFLDAAAARARDGAVQLVVVEGEAGIGKTSLMRSWAGGRDAADVVLFATCGDLAAAAPMDPLLSALSAHLHAVGAERARELLGADAPLLAPLLGQGDASRLSPHLADEIVGPTLLYSALASVVARVAGRGLAVLVLDDAHRSGAAMAGWLDYIRRRPVPLLVAMTVRTPEKPPVAGGARLVLGPLDEQQTEQLVGAARGPQLYARSGGHPLLLTELAMSAADAELPASLVEAVAARCDALGRAGAMLRSAAVVGATLDLDLLASVLNRPAVEVLDDAEIGVQHRLLDDVDGTFCFRHTLVRDALSASAGAGRAAWLHRQVSRVLSRRGDADPAEVAHHARLGGEIDLAVRALRDAAVRASERFDDGTAETLLDDALALRPDPACWLDRARVRTRRGDYTGAYRDVERAREIGASACEVGAWASYFDRRFDQAFAYAVDGAQVAGDPAVRARCLTIAGRTRHAGGDLAAADGLLVEGLEGSDGADRVIASAWLGVLRSHQSRTGEALALLQPATRPELAAEHTSAVLHALLFSGHALALAGRPAAALTTFDRYTAEVERRHVPRFAARGTNFSGWVLRSIGARDEAVDHHEHALQVAAEHGAPELRIAALEDLAEDRLTRGDPVAAERLLAAASVGLHGDLVFGWRLEMKLTLLRARVALAVERFDDAIALADGLAQRAMHGGIPRYAVVARLVGHAARRRSGATVPLAEVEADLEALDGAVALEAWWWIGDAAAAHGVPRWVDWAGRRAMMLAAECGDRRPGLQREAAERLEGWREDADAASRRGRSPDSPDSPDARHLVADKMTSGTTSGGAPVRAASARVVSDCRVGPSSPATKGARCAIPSRHDTSRAGVVTPASTFLTSTRTRPKTVRASASSASGWSTPGSTSALSRRYHSGDRNPKPCATSSTTAFAGWVQPLRNALAAIAGATRCASASAAPGSGRCPRQQAATTSPNALSANGSAVASPTTTGEAAPGCEPVFARAAAPARSIATETSTPTTLAAPARRAARPAAPVPAPTSSTRESRTATGEERSRAAASRSYTASGPAAHPAALASYASRTPGRQPFMRATGRRPEPAPPTTAAPRRSRRTPSPSRTGPGHPTATGTAGSATTARSARRGVPAQT